MPRGSRSFNKMSFNIPFQKKSVMINDDKNNES